MWAFPAISMIIWRGRRDGFARKRTLLNHISESRCKNIAGPTTIEYDVAGRIRNWAEGGGLVTQPIECTCSTAQSDIPAMLSLIINLSYEKMSSLAKTTKFIYRESEMHRQNADA